MIFNKIGRAASALAIAFTLATVPISTVDEAHAARRTEPYSCKIGGRTYNPQSSAIVIDAKTGNILAGDRIDAPRYPASMTKMMTAMLIFDAVQDGRLKLGDTVTVKITPEMQATHSNSYSTWLKDGTTMTVEQAIKAITVASANNVAVLMAEKLAGSEAAFVKLMNDKAQELGMSKTVFKNVSGLPDRQQVSTARDMAKLALHLYQNYQPYYGYFSAPVAKFGPWTKYNHNELAVKNKDIDGIKTGFICDAGYNVAISGTHGKDRVITVVFGGRTPYQRNQRAKSLTDKSYLILSAQQALGTQSASNKPVPNVNDDTKTIVISQNDATGPSTPKP